MTKDISEKINELSEKYKEDIKNLLPDTEKVKKSKQETLEQLLLIIGDKTGDKPTQEKIKQIEEEGEKRYSEKTPPGFNDKDKEEVRNLNDIQYQTKFGDLLIWKDMIDVAKTRSKKNVVFVTNDGQSNKKNDLLYKEGGKVIRANIFLLDEMKTKGDADLYIVSNDKFVETVETLTQTEKEELENIVNSRNYDKFKRKLNIRIHKRDDDLIKKYTQMDDLSDPENSKKIFQEYYNKIIKSEFIKKMEEEEEERRKNEKLKSEFIKKMEEEEERRKNEKLKKRILFSLHEDEDEDDNEEDND